MMKKLLLIALLLIWMGGELTAHAPVGLNLAYDQETKLLSVEFMHRSRNPEDHFVYSVKIAVNSEQVIEQSLMSQEKAEGGSLVFKIIDLKAGDEVNVQIECNKGGRRSRKLKIE
jgi:hypothetical protein